MCATCHHNCVELPTVHLWIHECRHAGGATCPGSGRRASLLGMLCTNNLSHPAVHARSAGTDRRCRRSGPSLRIRARTPPSAPLKFEAVRHQGHRACRVCRAAATEVQLVLAAVGLAGRPENQGAGPLSPSARGHAKVSSDSRSVEAPGPTRLRSSLCRKPRGSRGRGGHRRLRGADAPPPSPKSREGHAGNRRRSGSAADSRGRGGR